MKVKWLNGIIKKIKEWLDVKRNVHWIKKHKKDLREKYGGKSIIVYNQKLLQQNATTGIFLWRSVPYEVLCGTKCLV